MDSSSQYSLTALCVFENTINPELVRSFHVYTLPDGNQKELEREFLFSLHSPYVEMLANPLFTVRGLDFHQLYQGQVIGLWLCLFVFHSHFSSQIRIPSLLSLSRNPKLKSIPKLANDLQLILEMKCRTEDGRDVSLQSKRSAPVLDQDLNFLPYSYDISDEFGSFELNASGDVSKKRKRAASEDVAKIALDDLIKNFDLPIVEASKNLNVGLTSLKRKCRELGIPRWPHRKIKSLDSLIRDLQEEAERQKQENADAAKAVAKRQKMLEEEKETIESKPFTEIQSETKRFRQDVFKRRHRARAHNKQDQE